MSRREGGCRRLRQGCGRVGAYGYAVRARGVRDSGGAGASLIGLFPWKFPEGRISQDMFISKGISRNLHQGQTVTLWKVMGARALPLNC